MKKYILIFVTLFAACQKKIEPTHFNWTPKDSPEKLESFVREVKVNKTSSIIYKNQKIENGLQTFDRVGVKNTFIKKKFKKDQSLASIEALYLNETQMKGALPPIKYSKFKQDKEILRLEKLHRNLKIKSSKIFETLENDHSLFKKYLILEYELSNGYIYQARYTPSLKLYDIEQMGSHLAHSDKNNEFSAESTQAMTQVYPQGPKLTALTDVLLKNIYSEPALSNPFILVSNEAEQKITQVTPLLKFDPKDTRFDQVQVYYFMDKALDWMKTKLKIELTQKLEAVVNVGYPENTNTAFYYKGKIRLGRGDSEVFTSIASDPSIIYHETFHAAIDGMAGLPYEKEGGSLNEAFADFFTCVALGRPFLGEAAYLKGPFKRSLLTDKKLNERTGGLYHDSLIISSLLWEIKEKTSETEAIELATQILSEMNYFSDFESFNNSLIDKIKVIYSKEKLNLVQDILKKRGFRYE